MDLRQALALATIKKLRRRRAKKAAAARRHKGVRVKGGRHVRARRALPGGMSAEKALELAERFFREGRKPLAIAWARQAQNRAKVEGKSTINRRADEIIKSIRGEAVAKAMALLGDSDGIAMGKIMGLW